MADDSTGDDGDDAGGALLRASGRSRRQHRTSSGLPRGIYTAAEYGGASCTGVIALDSAVTCQKARLRGGSGRAVPSTEATQQEAVTGTRGAATPPSSRERHHRWWGSGNWPTS